MDKELSTKQYFMIVAQIDYLHWELERMLDASKKGLPIEIMIDKSTGWDKQQLSEAKKIITKIKKLRVKIDPPKTNK